MDSSEFDLDSPAIRTLGPLFKLTEIFIWDDGCSTINRKVSSLPKHIRFKYDSDDDDGHDSGGKISSSTSLEATEDSILTEDADLTQQMSALGLPVSFQTSKQKRRRQTKGKNKATHPNSQQSQKRSEDQEQRACKVSEESLFYVNFQDKSNSSSLSLPDRTELSCSGSDFSDDVIRFTSNIHGDRPPNLAAEHSSHAREEHILDSPCGNISSKALNGVLLGTDKQLNAEFMSIATTSSLSTGNTCSVNSMSDDPEQHGKEMDTSSRKQTGREFDVLGSSDHLSMESENLIVLGDDDNDNITCSGTSGDWSVFWDSFYMRYYFYNAKTQESTWDPPLGMENLAFDDMPCISSESNSDVPVINVDHAVLKYEDEQVDRNEMVDGTCHDEISLSSSLDTIGQSESLKEDTKLVDLGDFNNLMHLEEIESIENDFSMQDTSAATKRKKTRNRMRRKSFNDDEEVYVDITKYWCQRYLLFSSFDDGIKMDEEGWFSVTPEAIARHQASRSGGGIIIDCFTGVGGNAIQFANTSNHVIAIDIDSRKIDYAHHNAVIYGVEDRIDFIRGDCLSLAPNLKADVVFLSPPWGGPDYVKMKSYDISMLMPYDGQCLFNTFKVIASMIIMFLPKNVNLVQLAELSLSSNPPWSLEVEKNFLNGKLKAVTAYFSKTSV